MKFQTVRRAAADGGRTPHGVRGLKYLREVETESKDESHPSRGAWIEMDFAAGRFSPGREVAPLTGCVD